MQLVHGSKGHSTHVFVCEHPDCPSDLCPNIWHIYDVCEIKPSHGHKLPYTFQAMP